MKAKKIVMLISIILIIVGLTLAFLFTFKIGVEPKLDKLLVNILVGITSGALVALLTAIPSFCIDRRSSKSFLRTNIYHTYMYGMIFIATIDKNCKEGKMYIPENFGESSMQNILQVLIPLLHFDVHTFFSKCKRKQIELLILAINNFYLQREAIFCKLKIKLSLLKIQAIDSGVTNSEFTANDVKYELLEIRNEISSLCNTINNTMYPVLSNKEYKKWQMDIQGIEPAIKKEYGNVT